MDPVFRVHKLNRVGIERAQLIAERFDALLANLEDVCPPGRELAIVKTKLEEACFFAKKAMANEVKNQDLGETESYAAIGDATGHP